MMKKKIVLPSPAGRGHKHEHCGCGCGHEHEDHGCECGCGHEHSHSSSEARILLVRGGVCIVLGIIAALLPGRIAPFVWAAAWLAIGYDVLYHAVRGLFRGRFLDEHFLMSTAAVGAFCLGEYVEAVGVVLLYQLGEMLQACSAGKTRASVAGLMDIRPEFAQVHKSGKWIKTAPDKVEVGARILVNPGERIPLDGVVCKGSSALDTSALTGESAPMDVCPGTEVLSGAVNLSGALEIEVSRPYGQSTVARILALVEESGGKRVQAERFMTRFARIYTPIVTLAALLLAVLPPLLLDGISWNESIYRALVLLMISCPCALVISVPLTFLCGVGGASRQGILVKGGAALEKLTQVRCVMLDKTGTLTHGKFTVSTLHPAEGVAADELLRLAAAAEQHSSHPIGRSILERAQGLDLPAIDMAEELSGLGVHVTCTGQQVYAGNARLMESLGLTPAAAEGTAVHVAADGQYMGLITLADTLRPQSAEAIGQLHRLGIRTEMLTGDAPACAEAIGKQLGIDQIHAELLPDGKVELIAACPVPCAFAGDGINDAPALKCADVGLAMGTIGSDAAVEAADVVIMKDDPAKIAQAIGIARRTQKIAGQNIALSLAVKLAVLLLNTVGLVSMWIAVFADVGVAILAVLNAARAMKTR